MHPDIELFGLTLKAYTLMAFLGAIVFSAMALPALKKAGLNSAKKAVLLLSMCVLFLIGARLWNVAVSPKSYGGSLKWYSLKMTGLSLYGGILGAATALVVLLIVWKKNVFRVLDGLCLPFGAAFAIARIGCYLNGCCRGTPTDSFLGVSFPSKASSLPLGLLGSLKFSSIVHPTQLYELVGGLVALPIAYLIAKILKLREGGFFIAYGVLFCAVRLAVLPLRSLGYGEVITRIVYPALYIALMVLGVIFMIIREKAGGKDTAKA